MIDPHVTIRHEVELPKNDPGYVPLIQQDTINRDAKRRVITDYSGTPIISTLSKPSATLPNLTKISAQPPN